MPSRHDSTRFSSSHRRESNSVDRQPLPRSLSHLTQASLRRPHPTPITTITTITPRLLCRESSDLALPTTDPFCVLSTSRPSNRPKGYGAWGRSRFSSLFISVSRLDPHHPPYSPLSNRHTLAHTHCTHTNSLAIHRASPGPFSTSPEPLLQRPVWSWFTRLRLASPSFPPPSRTKALTLLFPLRPEMCVDYTLSP